MQFKVPQNIDMEDKIIGPLTMTQFLYLLIGGMIDYILLQTVLPTQPLVFFILAIPIGLFSLAMAFVKINDIPFPRFFQAVLIYAVTPKKRIWSKEIDLSSPIKIEAHKAKAKPKLIKTRIEKSEIEKMAAVLDTSGWAAVRDARLKEFVEAFEEKHHTLAIPQNQKMEVRNENDKIERKNG